jgi:putative ABC transport system ATP-binding protein
MEHVSPTPPALLVTGLRHAHQPDQPPVVELEQLALPPGTMMALTGPSGSGKITLAYLVTGIEPVLHGSVRWGDADLASLTEGERDARRRRHVGFVFQSFHLALGLSIRGHVLVSGWFDYRRPPQALRDRAEALLDRFAVPRQGR